MIFIYNTSIFLYSLLIKLASLFNPKAQLLLIGRKSAITLLNSNQLSKGAIWIHCASLGEFEQGRPLIEKIKSKYPNEKIILTFFSPSGYEIRKNYPLADHILYLPADTKHNARLFIESTSPKMAIFIKYEFWHHYYNALKNAQIPIYSASAIFRKNQLFFKSYGSWYRQILKNVTFFFCQDQNSLNLLQSIGLKNAQITGDTRFDRVAEIASSIKPIENIDKFANGKMVVVAGSTWAPDEEIIFSYLKNNPDIKLILAPHEIDNAHISKIETLVPSSYTLYTDRNYDVWPETQVLIINTIGLLSSLYQYSYISYIGGGFGKGIHNTLEAATFGTPILFGPNYQRFKEACDLINLEAAFSIKTEEEFGNAINTLLSNKEKRNFSGIASQHYVKSNTGATDKILNAIFS